MTGNISLTNGYQSIMLHHHSQKSAVSTGMSDCCNGGLQVSSKLDKEDVEKIEKEAAHAAAACCLELEFAQGLHFFWHLAWQEGTLWESRYACLLWIVAKQCLRNAHQTPGWGLRQQGSCMCLAK